MRLAYHKITGIVAGWSFADAALPDPHPDPKFTTMTITEEQFMALSNPTSGCPVVVGGVLTFTKAPLTSAQVAAMAGSQDNAPPPTASPPPLPPNLPGPPPTAQTPPPTP